MINSIGNSVLAENEKGFGKLFDEVYISSKQRSSFVFEDGGVTSIVKRQAILRSRLLNFFNLNAYYQCNSNTFSERFFAGFSSFLFFSKQDQIYEASFREDIKKRNILLFSIRFGKDITKIFFDFNL